MGRQGAALRDQEHHAAAPTCIAAMEKQMRAEREKRAVILTSEGERDAADQHRRGREAAGDQGVGGQPSSSRSTRPRARPRRSWRWPTATARGPPQGRRGASQTAGRPSRPCSCASPSSTCTSSATSPRNRQHADPAGAAHRRRRHDRHRDERHPPGGRGARRSTGSLAGAVPVPGDRQASGRAEAEDEIGGGRSQRIAQPEVPGPRIVESERIAAVAVPVAGQRAPGAVRGGERRKRPAADRWSAG